MNFRVKCGLVWSGIHSLSWRIDGRARERWSSFTSDWY